MLIKVKMDLRISHTKLDNDIQSNIEACKLDMERVGINKDTDDKLVEKLVKLYCRWQYNFENQGERYMQMYTDLRNGMSLSQKYKDVNIDV